MPRKKKTTSAETVDRETENVHQQKSPKRKAPMRSNPEAAGTSADEPIDDDYRQGDKADSEPERGGGIEERNDKRADMDKKASGLVALDDFAQAMGYDDSVSRSLADKSETASLHSLGNIATGIGACPYDGYKRGVWSPAFLFYPRSDLFTQRIRLAGGEGLNRHQIGQVFNYQANSRGGTSRASKAILNLLDERKGHFGQYQKMSGRLRRVKFFWKLSSEPNALNELIGEFEHVSGIKFPYNVGDAIKFPGLNLNTLRISEVTIRRMIWIIELLKQFRIVLPMHRILNHIRQNERSLNYGFDIDKRSVYKCVTALKNLKLCNTFERDVPVEQNKNNLHHLEIVTLPEVDDDENIDRAVEQLRQDYFRQGRVFPTGALRPARKIVEGEQPEKTRKSRKRKLSEATEGEGVERTPSEEQGETAGEVKRRRSSRRLRIFRKKDAEKKLKEREVDEVGEEVDEEEDVSKNNKKRRVRSIGSAKRTGKGVAAATGESDEFTRLVERPPPGSIRLREHRAKKGKKQIRTKKDMVDLQSERSRLSMRSRFSPKERDFLILIRAVGFFLNPIYRFWLDPRVMRDIMHEYVPESRNKTVQSLMAAGVREITKHNRMEYLQRIVKNLSTFPEMRDLRIQLAVANPESEAAKAQFFKTAFAEANKLLFLDAQSMPSFEVSDAQFKQYLDRRNLSIAYDKTHSNPARLRQKPPADLNDIHHGVAVNLLLSMLIDSSGGGISDALLQQVSASVMYSALSTLRSDGLVAKTKFVDTATNQRHHSATISFYFRHFFTHRFHPRLVDESWAYLAGADESFGLARSIEGDSPGEVILALTAFSRTENQLRVQVDTEIIQTIKTFTDETSATKQVRHLENVNLMLNKVDVAYTLNDPGAEVPSAEELVKILDVSCPSTLSDEDWHRTLALYDANEQRGVSALFSVIASTEVYGATLSHIMESTGLDKTEAITLLRQMTHTGQIVQVGVEERRWVMARYAAAWTVVLGERRVSPRPWINSDGGISLPTVRWFAEGILMQVVSQPGISLSDLYFCFDAALQRVCLEQLVELLEAAGCIEVVEDAVCGLTLESPFSSADSRGCNAVIVKYARPTIDAVERFARIFGSVTLLSTQSTCVGRRKELCDRHRLHGNIVDDLFGASSNVATASVSPSAQAASPLD